MVTGGAGDAAFLCEEGDGYGGSGTPACPWGRHQEPRSPSGLLGQKEVKTTFCPGFRARPQPPEVRVARVTLQSPFQPDLSCAATAFENRWILYGDLFGLFCLIFQPGCWRGPQPRRGVVRGRCSGTHRHG